MVSVPVTQVDCETQSVEKPTLLSKLQGWLKSPWVIGLMVIGLIWAMFQVAPPGEWKEAFERATFWMLALAVLLVLPHEALKVWRMEVLLPSVTSMRLEHLKTVFGMTCVGQLPVGTLGGDVYRICKLEECGADAKDATAATVIIRTIGFTVTLILAGIGAAIVFGKAFPLLGPLAALAILFILMTSKTPPRFIQRFLDKAEDVGSGKVGRAISATARLLRHVVHEAADLTRAQILKVLAITFAIYAARGVIVWVCFLAIGLETGYFAALIALAVGNFACVIPSPAGTVGLRESGMIGVLAGLGVAVAPGTIGALLFRGVIAIGAGLGVLLMLPVTAFTKSE